MKGSWIAVALLALAAVLGVFAVLRSNVAPPADAETAGRVEAAPHDASGGETPGAAAPAIVTELSAEAAGTIPPRNEEPLVASQQVAIVRGRVTDAEGAPLPGARVLVKGGVSKTAQELVAVTAADGRYEIGAPIEHPSVDVSASADGHASARATVTLLATGTRPASVDFALAELVTLNGRLVWDDDGAPIAGASVILERWIAPEARWPDFKPEVKLVTDEGGAFDATLAGGRVLSALVTPPGDKRGRRLIVELPASGSSPFTLRLARPASLTVGVDGPVEELVAANGRGKPALTVVLEPLDGGSDATRSATLAAGEALLEGLDPRREWNVLLRAGRFSAPLASAVRLKPGEQARLECRFDPLAMSADGPPGGPSTGAFQFHFRVLDASGRVLDGAELSQRTTVLSNGQLPALVRSLATGETDDPNLNSYEFDGLSAVDPPVTLEVQLGGSTVVRSPVGEGDKVDLVLPDLPDAATLRIVVRDAHGAERLPDRVALRRLTDDERRTVRIDARTGEIAAAVPAGAYEVRLLGATAGGAVPQRVELAAGESRTLEFTDAPCGAVRGWLQPPPAADAFANVQAHAAVGVKTMSPITAVVDADGRFELTTLPAGSWELTCVIAAGRGSAAPGPGSVIVQRIEVASGRCTEVTVPVAAPRGAPVSLRDSDGDGLARIVWLESEDAHVHLSVPVNAARPTSLRLPPGRYRTLSTRPGTYDKVIARGAFEVSADPSAPELVVDV